MIKEVDIDGNGRTFSMLKLDVYYIFYRWNRLWWVPCHDGKKVERNRFREAEKFSKKLLETTFENNIYTHLTASFRGGYQRGFQSVW